jgi:hypothetical protein
MVRAGAHLRQQRDHSSCTVPVNHLWPPLTRLIADCIRLHAFQKESINSCLGLQSARIVRSLLHTPLAARLLVKSP